MKQAKVFLYSLFFLLISSICSANSSYTDEKYLKYNIAYENNSEDPKLRVTLSFKGNEN